MLDPCGRLERAELRHRHAVDRHHHPLAGGGAADDGGDVVAQLPDPDPFHAGAP